MSIPTKPEHELTTGARPLRATTEQSAAQNVQQMFPKSIIPPKSVIRLKRKDSDMHAIEIGDSFRIGYYSKQDGPNCVWLVDAKGEYVQTWDQKSILDYFEIIERSNETDIYGAHSDALGLL